MLDSGERIAFATNVARSLNNDLLQTNMSSIFLSHNHKDKSFVRKLSERLQAHGIRTWVDEAEMRLGDSLLTKIETAIREFKYLGVVLSPNSVSSKWVRREVNMALNEEIHGNKVKVLPLLYQKCEIPGFLQDKVYADFTEDFEEGFEVLLAHLQSDLHQEAYKQRRAYEMLQQAYQDWLSFGQQEIQLLAKDKIILILEYLTQSTLSLDLMVYLFGSISYLRQSDDLDFGRLRHWLDRIGANDVIELFERLLTHENPRIRLGVTKTIERLAVIDAADLLVARIKLEDDKEVRRASLRCISRLGKRLPGELAHSLLNTDEDWLVQAYALQRLEQQSCLLISDETEFAVELGEMAQNAGFGLITFANPYSQWELDQLGREVLPTFKLVILVRGEHYTQQGREVFYSKLRRFVAEGGVLFATPWVSYETVYHHEFARVLPFKHIQHSFKEDLLVTCQPTENELAQKLFPRPISYQTSLELLQRKESSIVLLERDDHLPVFGYRRFGAGVCYYLNSCQHSCLGQIKSPLQSSPELRQGLQKVFEWIHKTPHQPRSSRLPTTVDEPLTEVKVTASSQIENSSENNSIKQQIINLTRRLQKLREIQALKGIDLEPHYLIEIEDLEARLDELQQQRKSSTPTQVSNHSPPNS
jgi:hypothetical protein